MSPKGAAEPAAPGELVGALRRGLAETFQSLAVRNFRRFFAGQFLAQVGAWSTAVGLTLLVFERTRSSTAVGLLTACQFGPVLALGVWAGAVSDRSDRRHLLVVVSLASKLCSAGLAVVVFLDVSSLAPLFCLAVLGGVATAFEPPARRTLVLEMVPDDGLANAVSLSTATMVGARVFGPALAGFLISSVGYGWCFVVDALTVVPLVACLVRLETDDLRPVPALARGRGQIRAGLRYVSSVPGLWIPLLLTTIVGLLTYNYTVVFPPLLQGPLGGNEGSFAVFFSISAIGSVLGALLNARRQVHTRSLVRAAVWFGAVMGALAAVPSLPVAYALALLLGYANTWFFVTGAVLGQVRASAAMQGRVIALFGLVVVGSSPIGGPVLGYVCDVLGPRVGVGVGAAGALGAALLGRVLDDRLGTEPEQGPVGGVFRRAEPGPPSVARLGFDGGDGRGESMTIQTVANKTLVREWFRLLSEGRLGEAAALTDPEGRMWSARSRTEMPFHVWYVGYQTFLDTRFDGGLRFEVDAVTAEDDRVSVLTTGAGTLADGTPFDNRYHWLVEADGTRITSIREYHDTKYFYDTFAGGSSG